MEATFVVDGVIQSITDEQVAVRVDGVQVLAGNGASTLAAGDSLKVDRFRFEFPSQGQRVLIPLFKDSPVEFGYSTYAVDAKGQARCNANGQISFSASRATELLLMSHQECRAALDQELGKEPPCDDTVTNCSVNTTKLGLNTGSSLAFLGALLVLGLRRRRPSQHH